MKIALVITCLGVGGAERVVVDLADSLAVRGHEVRIYYLTGDALLKPSNSSIMLYGLNLNSYFDLIRSSINFVTHLRGFNPDIVHSHLFHANIFTRLMRPFLGIRRLISTAHIKSENMLRMLAYRFTDSLTDINTNVSKEATSYYINNYYFKPHRILTVHNGISTKIYRFSEVARSKIRTEFKVSIDKKIILAVGRLHDQKDYPNLLSAISKLKSNPAEYFVFIAGTGPLNDELQAFAMQLDLTDRVKFIGLRRDIPDLMSASDIFVLSSKLEGFPMVIGEAMASECLVVGTDCGGVKEFIGDTGLLVPPSNADSLATMLDYALSMPYETRKALGCSARARVEQYYSLERAVTRWVSIYNDQYNVVTSLIDCNE